RLEPDGHVTDYATREPRAVGTRAKLDRERILDDRGQRIEPRRMQIPAMLRVDLARDADHTEAVAAIRRDVDVENLVSEAQILRERGADGRIGIQNQEALHVVGKLELACRAEHPM